MVRMPELTGGELSLLRSFAGGPRIWDAASLQLQVTVLSGLGLIEPALWDGEDGPVSRGAYRLTQAGRQVLEMVPEPGPAPAQDPGPDPEQDLEDIRAQARRYLEARFGQEVWFRAPETFANMLERWIWAVASTVPELAEECITEIEQALVRPEG